MENNIGLVLEGGGFRGLYTAGILHYFAEKGLEFPYIIGVSMGASNATNYLAKQTQRNLDVPYTFINDKRYISYRRLLRKGELFGMDFIFNDIPNSLIPFDYSTFSESNQRLIYVTTDCDTGNAYYVENTDSETSFKALEASTSLPFAAKMVALHGKQLLDGGISNPIPIEKALEDGCEKLVVILTQPKGYRKSPFTAKYLAQLKYKRYPKLVDLLLTRHHIYNQQLDLLEQLEKQGRALIIRPGSKLPISRTEKNKNKLKESFDLGCQKGNEVHDTLFKFIGE